MKHPLLFETENHHWSLNYPKRSLEERNCYR